ncbi:MAG TPA: RNA-binding transcriptional accessory protein [Legionella sp.]|nr:RNA-binding transcriptional accessory protein [Legionella sp.]
MTQARLSTAAAIARELNAQVSQVDAAIRLLDEGASVPFIARYRKEATNGLDDTQLRILAERLHYLRELDDRRSTVLKTLQDLDQLTPELQQAIQEADTKTRLEDLYLPFRPKRRTKALLAKEAGLLPLAQALWQDPTTIPEVFATQFIHPGLGIDTAAAALEGARHILMEQFAEDANLLEELRQYLWKNGVLKSTAAKNKEPSAKNKEPSAKNKRATANANKFSDYFDYAELIKKIPSHRALALFRGRRESAIQFALTLPHDEHYGEQRVATYFNIANQNRAADAWLLDTVRMTWATKLFTKLELELFTRLRELADEEAIRVFTHNLRDLLLSAPAGAHVTMGLDPGIRTGVKVVVVDATGKLLDYTAVFPLAPQNEWHQALASLAKLAAKYHVSLISIGNGTGSRETERLVADLIKMYPDLSLTKVVVSEAGASVYSASELAAHEFPDLDVTLRGAVSIARRLQDPLAELVKIDPKAIGVGQYQHDVNQPRLARSLEGVVEDCVNQVGVDINMASAALLTHVSGLNETLAKNIVQYRDEHGRFHNREQLKAVPRMGDKTFQQAAGFLRIMNGDNPLDASGVHPESYSIVERILNDHHVDMSQVLGNVALLQAVNANQYVDDQHGLPTISDILQELEKPGRDPRPAFKTVQFKEGVETIGDLQIGMILDGVVSNVTNFGAFVDVGVHQDGLVHISAMTERFITDPRAVVKAGDVVTVKVIEVDVARKRIGLTMKLNDTAASVSHKKPVKPEAAQAAPRPKAQVNRAKKPMPPKTPSVAPKATVFNTSMADALTKLKRGVEQ